MCQADQRKDLKLQAPLKLARTYFFKKNYAYFSHLNILMLSV